MAVGRGQAMKQGGFGKRDASDLEKYIFEALRTEKERSKKEDNRFVNRFTEDPVYYLLPWSLLAYVAMALWVGHL